MLQSCPARCVPGRFSGLPSPHKEISAHQRQPHGQPSRHEGECDRGIGGKAKSTEEEREHGFTDTETVDGDRRHLHHQADGNQHGAEEGRQLERHLNGHLDAIERDSAIRAVVFTSAKPGIFIAGADLHAVARLVIGPTRSPRRRYRAADRLDIRCRRCGTVFADVQWHGERCRCCGADLWGTSVEKSIRKKWIRATDAERMAGLVG